MKLVIFLLYNNLFIYQVLCTLIYHRCSLYSFLPGYISLASSVKLPSGKWLHWWFFNIDSGNGLAPSGNKPLSEPMLTKLYEVIGEKWSLFRSPPWSGEDPVIDLSFFLRQHQLVGEHFFVRQGNLQTEYQVALLCHINLQNNHKRHPIAHLWRWYMWCVFLVLSIIYVLSSYCLWYFQPQMWCCCCLPLG